MNCFRRGTTPAGVTWPLGATSVTLSPARTPSERASSTPSTMSELARHQLGQGAALQGRGQVGDLGFLAPATMPRTHGAAHVLAARQQRLRCDEGRRADHLPGVRRGPSASVRARSASAAPLGTNTSMCEITLSMRSRTSFWKPFITDSTMISAATPSAMPSIDTPEMKEMNPLRRVAAAGARVAPADLPFVGHVHCARMLTEASPAASSSAMDNRRMHLIVPFAAPPQESMPAALPGWAAPALDKLLGRWAATQRDDADSSTLSPPHERAHAAALGLSGADGCLPWAAHQAARDGIDVGARTWGLLTPAHWRVGSDGVHLADAEALALGVDESRALFDAVRPLFESEGYGVAWGAALRWYAAHPSLQGLATASLDRVVGRNIAPWLPRQPQAKALRRLQNEVQMLLHGHPVNAAREATGRLAVNSFWLSGCGVAQRASAAGVRVDDRLRGPLLRGDVAAWGEAWRALDEQEIAPLLAAAERGEPRRLTLCGERGSVTLGPRGRSLWQRVGRVFAPARGSASAVLESL